MTAHGWVVVFDLGGVLINWNPRHLYRKLFQHETEMEDFLANICTAQWNLQQDAGRSLTEACAALKLEHPDRAAMIDAWFKRFDEMMLGPIVGTVDILAELREREVPIGLWVGFSTTCRIFLSTESPSPRGWIRHW